VSFGAEPPVTDAGLTWAGAMVTGPQNPYGNLGGPISAGDVNGDGLDDALVGAAWHDSALVQVSLYLGGPGSRSTPDALYIVMGEALYISTGLPMSVGDVNGDGFDDVVAGDHGYRGTGAAYLTYGGGRGTVLISGAPRGADLGYSVAGGGGDVDGDGLDDIVVSEPQAHRSRFNQSAGGAWLIRGSHRRVLTRVIQDHPDRHRQTRHRHPLQPEIAAPG